MRESIAPVSLGAMLREKLEAIAAARFGGVEIFESGPPQFAGAPDGSELLHLRATPFGDRFFLEVIERRGGHDRDDRYGAPIAPVRLAALAQWRAAREAGAER